MEGINQTTETEKSTVDRNERKNFQEERKGTEMRVATMFEGIGMEALGRIRENPKIEDFSSRNLN
jgi:hypothetical protein